MAGLSGTSGKFPASLSVRLRSKAHSHVTYGHRALKPHKCPGSGKAHAGEGMSPDFQERYHLQQHFLPIFAFRHRLFRLRAASRAVGARPPGWLSPSFISSQQ